jgi:hypothetical protein
LVDFQNRFPRLCECLLEARRHERIGQAYLFVGDNAPLLADFVRAFTQLCACRSLADNGDACGGCKPCRRLATETYPERYLITPQSKSRQILVDEIRELEHQLNLAVAPGVIKFGIIAEAECMTEQAQNAFLKTLEEPTPSTMILLYTTRPGRLLPTIRSRCQTISLMTNRRTYENAEAAGLFPLLAKLRPHAGAAVGLEVSAKLQVIFAAIRKQAEALVEQNRDHNWDTLAEGDPKLKKKLEEKRAAKVEAEYRRRRAGIDDAIQTWFLQQMLAAAGIPEQNLPQREMIENLPAELKKIPENTDDAEKNILLAEELIRCMRGNVPEPLALDVFCLSVTEKPRKRKKVAPRT